MVSELEAALYILLVKIILVLYTSKLQDWEKSQDWMAWRRHPD